MSRPRSTAGADPYPQPDPGAQLRLPGLFCPGRAVAALPDSPEPGRLYGLPVGSGLGDGQAGRQHLSLGVPAHGRDRAGQPRRLQRLGHRARPGEGGMNRGLACYAASTPAGQRDTDQGKTPPDGQETELKGPFKLPNHTIGFSVTTPRRRTSRLVRSLGATGGRGKPPRFIHAYSLQESPCFQRSPAPAICRCIPSKAQK